MADPEMVLYTNEFISEPTCIIYKFALEWLHFKYTPEKNNR